MLANPVLGTVLLAAWVLAQGMEPGAPFNASLANQSAMAEEAANFSASEEPPEHSFSMNEDHLAAQPADQAPQQESVPPTRPPADPARHSTFPPLNHQDASSIAATGAPKLEGTTAAPLDQPKNDQKDGAGFFCGNVALVLAGGAALHLFH